MRNAMREASDISSNTLEQQQSVENLPAVSYVPSDWGTEKPVSQIRSYCTGQFSQSFASGKQDVWSKAAEHILPVLAFTVSSFTNTSIVGLKVKQASACDEVIIIYDFKDLSTFANLVGHSQAQLLEANAKNALIDKQNLAVSLINGNNGKPLDIRFAAEANGLSLNVTSQDESLFEGWWNCLFECFEFYGTQLQASPTQMLVSFDLVPPRQLSELRKVNDTIVVYPRHSDLISELLKSTAADPYRTALIANEQQISMAELLVEARAIAGWLTSICDPMDRAVGVVVDRSDKAYAVYIGILMAGGYYVPVSPKNPSSRIEQIFADAETCTVIVLEEGEALPSSFHRFENLPLNRDSQFQPRKRTADSIAYAIYTSGSTGKPKGVLITDRNVLRFAINASHITWEKDDRLGAISSHGFDASTFEIWSALLNCIPIICLGKEAITELDLFRKIVREKQVSVMVITSALLTHIVASDIEALAPLRYLIYGGELTAIETVRRLRGRFPQLELIHAYGPTENTVLSTVYPVGSVLPDRVPIGRPLANSTAWVVDDHYRPLPAGARGMLIVSGDGVAKGYIKRPEATSKHFIVLPEHLRQREGERGYITGDVARWNSEFQLEFLGRADNQIKIRGFRIELDEVRAALTGLPHVVDAEVLPITADHGGVVALEAFVVFQDTTPEIIRAKLAEQLPDYMIPKSFHQLASLPFNASGKVDRHALATMRPVASESALSDARNENDRRLLAIWKKLFGVQSLSIDDSYSSLGGHSMMMLEMADMVFDEFNLDIALTDLVVLTTVRQVSDALALQQQDLGQNS